MKDRTKLILESGVRDYIKTGIPITSARLFDVHDFGIRPAMIRCELNALGSLGYFSQNHPSGGRIPTHKAYRFFVDGILKNNDEEKKEKRETRPFVSELVEGRKKEFIENLSEYLGVLSVGYEPRGNRMYGSGLSDLFSRLEFEAKEEFLRIVEDFESLEKRMSADFWEDENEWPRVFIGKSPITRSRHLSVIADKIRPGRENFFVFMIGPNRMDYEKSLELLKSMEDSFL